LGEAYGGNIEKTDSSRSGVLEKRGALDAARISPYDRRHGVGAGVTLAIRFASIGEF
jgi:hypothetical protein|tara:strand:+ start:1103 stop:1273 length:171 start_codon:yes stop_codon:yes gene_type:complete